MGTLAGQGKKTDGPSEIGQNLSTAPEPGGAFFRSRRALRQARLACVGRIAAGIDDPVLRLRFLQMTAPQEPDAGRSGRRLRWVLWAAALSAALLVPLLVKLAAGNPEPAPFQPISAPPAPAVQTTAPVQVWLVEQTGDSEVYSNGLRIDTRYTVATRPRQYLAFSRRAPNNGVVRTPPAGIVYHTTESCQAPFEADATPTLERLGESLLAYVRRKRAYHYVIDRFGRVYRVVAESGIANHAGYSVWADDQWFYVDLNSSFLGVAFEAQTQPVPSGEVASQAQVRAAAMLTEMLRSRYNIPAADCVTHAQVSVNPSSMLVGYHTDWSSGFPFQALGLPDNYSLSVPAIWAFGFNYGTGWLRSAPQLLSAVELAQQDLSRQAAAAGMSLPAYRKELRRRYHEWLAEARRRD